MPSCPKCQSPRTACVADHYQAHVRRPDADPAALAPLAPPLRRSILPGTLAISLFWMAVLCPGFVPSKRALPVALSFAVAGLVAFYGWLRARKGDRLRMSAYLKSSICQDCGHTF